MSRGIGALQREILDVVQQNAAGGAPAGKVAAMSTGQIEQKLSRRPKPQRRSVNRALRGLRIRALLVALDDDDDQPRDSLGSWTELMWTTPAEYSRASSEDDARRVLAGGFSKESEDDA
jgi:hypothetical protein